MASNIRIFSPSGIELDNIIASTKRSWISSSRGAEGDCVWEMSTLDEKTTEKNLCFGNIVVIEHDNLPDWVGVIDCSPAERAWSYGKVTVTAYTAERLCKFGTTRNETRNATYGGLFRAALDYYNEDTALPIFAGQIDDNGLSRQETFGSDPFTHIQRIAGRSGGEWDVTADFSSGKLSLRGNWYTRTGVNTGVMLFDGDNGNIEMKEPILSEGALPIYNTIVGYSDAPTAGTRLKSKSSDEASRAKYGIRILTKVYTGITTQSGLDVAVNLDLKSYNKPIIQHEISVIDSRIFNLLRRGNIFDIDLSGSGFSQYGGIGYQGKCKVYSIEYDDAAENRVALGVETYDS